ncbi:MAG TPA: hypothetical protein VFF78_06100 [Anaerolineaceae bacterium]|nr:hypothetical protein [Anaerolineaceae bacterium]
MTKSKPKSTDRKFEADLALVPGLRLVPQSSSRQPVESEFPVEENFNDPDQRQRTVGKLIDFFKKY